MKKTLVCLLFATACATTSNAPKNEPLNLSPIALDASSEAFAAKPGYVQVTTPYQPLKPFVDDLRAREKKELQTRGESHITVITPPEFAVLKAHIKRADLDRLAQPLQQAKIEAVCVGEGAATVDGARETTYFLVVKAPALIEYRKEIQKIFVQRGGAAKSFDAEHFYPHITLGFTKQDLHEQQGVIKDNRACVYPVTQK